MNQRCGIAKKVSIASSLPSVLPEHRYVFQSSQDEGGVLTTLEVERHWAVEAEDADDGTPIVFAFTETVGGVGRRLIRRDPDCPDAFCWHGRWISIPSAESE